MDDISGMIGRVLSDPAAMEQIRSLSGLLTHASQNGTPSSSEHPEQSANPLSDSGLSEESARLLNNLLSSVSADKKVGSEGAVQNVSAESGKKEAHSQTANTSSLMGQFGGIDPSMLSMIMKFIPLMQSVNAEDDSTRLLRSLRPFLREERALRLDSAVRLLGIMKLLPLLKNL